MALTKRHAGSPYANIWLQLSQKDVSNVFDITADEDAELSELAGYGASKKIKRKMGTAVFIAPAGGKIKINAVFKLLNAAFEYKFEKLFRSKADRGATLEAAGSIECRPRKPFNADIMKNLLQTVSPNATAAIASSLKDACDMAAKCTAGIIGFLKRYRLDHLLTKPCFMYYAYFDQLQTVEKVYGGKVVERVIHFVHPEDLQRLYIILTTGVGLIDLCFHPLKNKLSSNFNVLPELSYTKLMKLKSCMSGHVSELEDPVYLCAVRIYSEILRANMNGISYAESNNDSTIFKPKVDGNSATDLYDIYQNIPEKEHAVKSVNWMIQKGVIFQVNRCNGQTSLVYTADAYQIEKEVACSVAAVVKNYKNFGEEVAMSLRLTPYDKADSIILKDSQLAAYKHAISSPITIITGRAGTGKSQVIKKIVEHYDSQYIALLAPTGKLSSSLRERVMPAYTLHKAVADWQYSARNRVCQSQDSSKRPKKKEPTDAEKLLELIQTACRNACSQQKDESSGRIQEVEKIKLLIVDDLSLVDPAIFRSLMDLLVNRGNLMKIVLAGDPKQLPSIRWGCMLEEFIKALPNCLFTLERNYRNDSQTIFDNATKILNGDPNLTTDSSFSIKKIDHSQLQYTVKSLLEGELKDVAIQNLQFIAFTRVDVAAINNICRTHYLDIPSGVNVNSPTFFVGEKIYLKRNMPFYDIYNGQMWIIKEIFDASIDHNGQFDHVRAVKHTKAAKSGGESRHRFVRLISESGRDERVLCTSEVPFSWKNVSSGFATTIHKYQGNENEWIIYICTKLTSRDTKKHFYTAETRSTKRFIALTNQRFLSGISRRPCYERMSALSQMLQEQLSTVLL